MRRVARVVGLIVVLWLVTVGSAAQQPAAAPSSSSWSFDAVPGATSTVLVVAWDHGYDDDADGECGLARVLADCRLTWARQAVPEAGDTGVLVLGDVTLAYASLPAGAPQLGAFAAALLDPAAGLTDDQIALLTEPSGSGARYGWPSDGAGYVWWTKGPEAMLLWREAGTESELLTRCRERP